MTEAQSWLFSAEGGGRLEDKQQIGDGSDNFGQAASQAAKAARELSRETAKQAAKSGAEATANAAAATVKAGVESGKAVSEIAAGTAAGGPWGAILSAAWAMRHTLFKVLVCIFLVQLIFVVMIVSLPSIIMDQVFGMNGQKPTETQTLENVYSALSDVVTAQVESCYTLSLQRVEQIIEDGSYDYDLSMEALINHAQSSAGFDVSYILAAYSASMGQRGATAEDMVAKLNGYQAQMFPVTQEEKTKEQLVPVSYMTYRPVTVTVVTEKVPAAIVNGVQRYNYVLGERTLYVPDTAKTSDTEITVPKYKEVTVSLPIYGGGRVTGTRNASYYEADGEETLQPTTEIIKYVECTIHPFDHSVIINAFEIDMSAEYPQFHVTYGTAIQNMANSLKMTLYGTLGNGKAVPLTDAELIAFVKRQDCSEMRKHIITTGLSLVGKVPYFWGGKSAAGWNDEWNTPKLVTAAGSTSSGTIRPFGLDCSGFSDWTYRTAVGTGLQTQGGQWESSTGITAEELLPGDLGFLLDETGDWTHVLIFAGYGEEGERKWVHSAGGVGVVLNTPSYEAGLALRRPNNMDFDAPVTNQPNGEPLYALEVDVTHYCACKKCCGENAKGITASGKPVAVGMVAMSSSYPFGTQIMINGIMYTVEDRGGSGIENDPSRVDIYVPDHDEALRLGRFTTTAYVYRIGR